MLLAQRDGFSCGGSLTVSTQPRRNVLPLRMGYLIPEFPAQTHVFFWREVVALREMGVGVTLISTRRTPIEACRHAFADEARRETHYVYPPLASRSAQTLAAHPVS